MNRASRIACLLVAALLVPASAEARKMRFGGSKSSSASSQAKPSEAKPDRAASRRSTVIVAPGIGVSRAKAGEPERVPFPPSTLRPAQQAPAAQQASAQGEAKRPWCGGEVVVGGFCVVN